MSEEKDQSAIHFGAVGFKMQTDSYDTCRPRYPAAALTDALESIGKERVSTVLDLAAGTGIFTRLLNETVDEGVVIDVLEPTEEMVRDKLFNPKPSKVRERVMGEAAKIEAADKTYDIVFVAQAFHWFATIEAVRDMHRVLKDDGFLVFVWNMEDREAQKWVARLRDVYEPYDGDVPQYRRGTWREVWQTDEAKQLFGETSSSFYKHEMTRTREAVKKLVFSKSYIARQTDETRKEIAKQIDQILLEELGEQQDEDETIQLPYTTEVFLAPKKVQ